MTDQTDRAVPQAGQPLINTPEYDNMPWPCDGRDYHYGMVFPPKKRSRMQGINCCGQSKSDGPSRPTYKSEDVVEGPTLSFEEQLGTFKDQAFPDLCQKCFYIHVREFCEDFRVERSLVMKVENIIKLAKHFRTTDKNTPRFVAEHKLHT